MTIGQEFFTRMLRLAKVRLALGYFGYVLSLIGLTLSGIEMYIYGTSLGLMDLINVSLVILSVIAIKWADTDIKRYRKMIEFLGSDPK